MISREDMCVCGHKRIEHNNRIQGNYFPLLEYNCCMNFVDTEDGREFCDCTKFSKCEHKSSTKGGFSACVKCGEEVSINSNYGKQDSDKTNSLGMGKISVGAELAHNSNKKQESGSQGQVLSKSFRNKGVLNFVSANSNKEQKESGKK